MILFRLSLSEHNVYTSVSYSDYCLNLVDTSSGDWLVSNMSPVTSLLYIFLRVDINISCVHPQPDTSHVFVP